MRSAPYRAAIAPGNAGGLLDLRATTATATLISRAIRTRLPATVGHIERSASLVILTLGPDRWLIRIPKNNEQEQYDRFELGIGSAHGMVTVVSDAYASITIQGEEAVAVLAQGCPLDFDLTTFPIGTCASSVLARGHVLLIRVAAGFELLVDRTHASYFRQWLHAAAGSEASQNSGID